jgi:hypothetical protein
MTFSIKDTDNVAVYSFNRHNKTGALEMEKCVQTIQFKGK